MYTDVGQFWHTSRISSSPRSRRAVMLVHPGIRVQLAGTGSPADVPVPALVRRHEAGDLGLPVTTLGARLRNVSLRLSVHSVSDGSGRRGECLGSYGRTSG